VIDFMLKTFSLQKEFINCESFLDTVSYFSSGFPRILPCSCWKRPELIATLIHHFSGLRFYSRTTWVKKWELFHVLLLLSCVCTSPGFFCELLAISTLYLSIRYTMLSQTNLSRTKLNCRVLQSCKPNQLFTTRCAVWFNFFLTWNAVLSWFVCIYV